MKVLYIGHYREGTGWSQAAIDYILALDSVGVDVVCRPLKLNQNKPQLPERILQLEAKSSKGSTHCIQHVLPHHMEWSSKFEKNIGLFVTETQSINWSPWPARLKLMDELWVPNMEMMDVCDKAVNVDVKIVPHATPPNKYDHYDEFDIPKMKDKFLFYFIGEFNRRKRVSALLQAYYTEFDRNDNVGLIIKSNIPGKSPEETLQLLTETDQTVRKELKLYPNDYQFPAVTFITQRLTDRQINGLHRRGDCFVTTTFGDAWCIPAMDALHFNNNVISTDIGGMRDYLHMKELCILVDGQPTPVFGNDHAIPGMGTGREKWCEVNIPAFSGAMRALYEINKKVEYDLSEYSYESIGNKMKDLLNA